MFRTRTAIEFFMAMHGSSPPLHYFVGGLLPYVIDDSIHLPQIFRNASSTRLINFLCSGSWRQTISNSLPAPPLVFKIPLSAEPTPRPPATPGFSPFSAIALCPLHPLKTLSPKSFHIHPQSACFSSKYHCICSPTFLSFTRPGLGSLVDH